MDYYLRMFLFMATALGIGVGVKWLQGRRQRWPRRPVSSTRSPSLPSVAVAPPRRVPSINAVDLLQLEARIRQAMTSLAAQPVARPSPTPPPLFSQPVFVSRAGAGVSDPIAAKVREIVAQQFEVPVDRVTMGSRFGVELNADSLSIVELVLAIEEAFGLDMPDEDAMRIRSVGDAVAWVQEQRPSFAQ